MAARDEERGAAAPPAPLAPQLDAGAFDPTRLQKTWAAGTVMDQSFVLGVTSIGPLLLGVGMSVLPLGAVGELQDAHVYLGFNLLCWHLVFGMALAVYKLALPCPSFGRLWLQALLPSMLAFTAGFIALNVQGGWPFPVGAAIIAAPTMWVLVALAYRTFEAVNVGNAQFKPRFWAVTRSLAIVISVWCAAVLLVPVFWHAQSELWRKAIIMGVSSLSVVVQFGADYVTHRYKVLRDIMTLPTSMTVTLYLSVFLSRATAASTVAAVAVAAGMKLTLYALLVSPRVREWASRTATSVHRRVLGRVADVQVRPMGAAAAGVLAGDSSRRGPGGSGPECADAGTGGAAVAVSGTRSQRVAPALAGAAPFVTGAHEATTDGGGGGRGGSSNVTVARRSQWWQLTTVAHMWRTTHVGAELAMMCRAKPYDRDGGTDGDDGSGQGSSAIDQVASSNPQASDNWAGARAAAAVTHPQASARELLQSSVKHVRAEITWTKPSPPSPAEGQEVACYAFVAECVIQIMTPMYVAVLLSTVNAGPNASVSVLGALVVSPSQHARETTYALMISGCAAAMALVAGIVVYRTTGINAVAASHRKFIQRMSANMLFFTWAIWVMLKLLLAHSNIDYLDPMPFN